MSERGRSRDFVAITSHREREIEREMERGSVCVCCIDS